MRREERVTVQGPVKEQQPDGMSHRRGNQGWQGDGWGFNEGRWGNRVVSTPGVRCCGFFLGEGSMMGEGV